jgi:hypothetical protein
MPDRNIKKLLLWNTPGHAHEVTFSCYRRADYPSCRLRDNTGLIPDVFTAPVLLSNAQAERFSVV